MTDAETLLPCPCCKSPARLQTDKGRTGVACISVWFRQYAHCKNKKCGIMTRVFKRPGQATRAWNTRARVAAPSDSRQAVDVHKEKYPLDKPAYKDKEYYKGYNAAIDHLASQGYLATPAQPVAAPVVSRVNPVDAVAKEISDICKEYRRQIDENGYADTPGGIEHKGDAFILIQRWNALLEAAAKETTC